MIDVDETVGVWVGFSGSFVCVMSRVHEIPHMMNNDFISTM